MAMDNRYKMNSMGVPLPPPLPSSVLPVQSSAGSSLSLPLVGTFLGRTKQAITLVNLKHGMAAAASSCSLLAATFFLFYAAFRLLSWGHFTNGSELAQCKDLESGRSAAHFLSPFKVWRETREKYPTHVMGDAFTQAVNGHSRFIAK